MIVLYELYCSLVNDLKGKSVRVRICDAGVVAFVRERLLVAIRGALPQDERVHRAQQGTVQYRTILPTNIDFTSAIHTLTSRIA